MKWLIGAAFLAICAFIARRSLVISRVEEPVVDLWKKLLKDHPIAYRRVQ